MTATLVPGGVRVDGVTKVYPSARHSAEVRALDGVSMSIAAGEIVGLVGASGSGKTTLARVIMRLTPATAGRVWINGTEVLGIRRRSQLRAIRRRVQMISQDPFESLHPGMMVKDIVGEPLVIHRIGTAPERHERIAEALEGVSLAPAEAFLDRYPHHLSGGQRQRVAIARAVILQPAFLIADEPTSMLDASVQMEILNVLLRLRSTGRLSALVITHDLALARYVCDRVAVMLGGRIVEEGRTEDVITRPQHQYTEDLLAASDDLA